MEKSNRKIIIPIFAAILAFGAFSRTIGAENVRAVQVLALIAGGFGLGVGYANFLNKYRKEKNQ